MTYHTNHCWCSSSNWNEDSFDGEVMVYFGKKIDNDSICGYKDKIKDPDFKKLTEEKKFFNQSEYDRFVEIRKEIMEERGKDTSKIDFEDYKDNFHETINVLKPEILEWLNKNIENSNASLYTMEEVIKNTLEKNKSDFLKNTLKEIKTLKKNLEKGLFSYKEEKIKIKEIENKILESEYKDILTSSIKSWCVGSSTYDVNDRDVKVFFKRQIDALKFIHEFSVFKEPTFYFDYFNDERKEPNSEKILNIVNEELNLNYKVEDLNEKDDRHKTSFDMDPRNYQLLDWEIDSDDIHLNKEEVTKVVQNILLDEYKEDTF